MILYDYGKMESLVDDLELILKKEDLSSEDLSLFSEKVEQSEEYFVGNNGNSFRDRARKAIAYSRGNSQGKEILSELVKMLKTCIVNMQEAEKSAAEMVSSGFKH